MTHLRFLLAGLALLSILLVGAIGFWIATPTSAFYRHVSTVIEPDPAGGWKVKVTRDIPRGPFDGRWRLVVWVKRGDDSYSCIHPSGPGGTEVFSDVLRYGEKTEPTISYALPNTVEECMRQAPPLAMTWTRQARLWAWLWLRPDVTTITLQAPLTTSQGDN
jgi:hypothetical protein